MAQKGISDIVSVDFDRDSFKKMFKMKNKEFKQEKIKFFEKKNKTKKQNYSPKNINVG